MYSPGTTGIIFLKYQNGTEKQDEKFAYGHHNCIDKRKKYSTQIIFYEQSDKTKV